MSAADLRGFLLFQKRGDADDGFGHSTGNGPFATVFELRGQFIPAKGTEEVVNAAVQGLQSYTLRVRATASRKAINNAWRVVDKHDTSRVFNIVSVVDPDQRNRWLDVTVTQGELA